MSIALNARIKDMERELADLKRSNAFLDEWMGKALARIEKLDERLTALENRPKPGRPPKNG